jgi:hypothetical protein
MKTSVNFRTGHLHSVSEAISSTSVFPELFCRRGRLLASNNHGTSHPCSHNLEIRVTGIQN